MYYLSRFKYEEGINITYVITYVISKRLSEQKQAIIRTEAKKYHKKVLCILSDRDEHEGVTSPSESLSVYCVVQFFLQNRKNKLETFEDAL